MRILEEEESANKEAVEERLKVEMAGTEEKATEGPKVALEM